MNLKFYKNLQWSKFLLIFLVQFSFTSVNAAELVAKGASWKYNDSGSNLGTAWRATGYDDSSWSSGNADLGFGNGNTTTLTNHAGSGGGITYYFRHELTITDTSDYVDFIFELIRDDGAVVYVNGTEVWRSNMPSGAITYTTPAAGTVGGSDESTYFTTTLADVFQNGTNVIAVEIHQINTGSSDISFDLGVTGNEIPPYIDYGADWKYLDDGSDQGTAWYGTGYNDAAWASGPGELGYGDGGEGTVVSYGPSSTNKYITTYFRKTLNITGFSATDLMQFSLIRDDGAAVYLNGVEIYRNNLDPAAAYSDVATSNVSGSGESTPLTFLLPATSFIDGSNVIAVEIHQDDDASSDISMDLQLQNLGTLPTSLSRGPYIQMLTQTSANIKWRTGNLSNSVVAYGDSPANLIDTVKNLGTNFDHELTILGLTEGTKYYYSFGTTDTVFAGADSDHFFTTAPASSSTDLMRAWVLGDAGTANANQRAVRDAYLGYVGAGTTDMVLMLGDNAYNDGTDEQYQDAMFENMYEDVLRNTVTYSCPGNHDIYTASSSSQSGPYYDIFSFPKAGECGGLASGTEAYYSWDYGQTHFISLDSDDSPRNVGGTMYTWLNNDLAATTKKWIVVIFHHPPYTKGSHDSDDNSDSGGRMRDMRENILPLLESYGVDLVMSGHSHSYERSYLLKGHFDVSSTFASSMQVDAGSGKLDVDCSYKKTTSGPDAGDGAVYITAGSSGKVTGTLTAHPAMYAYLYQLGSVVLEIEENRMDVKFVNNSGGITDYFSIDKDVYNASIDSTIQLGDNIVLTASWAEDFVWSPGGATTQSIDVAPGDTTQYIVTNSSGCLADTFNVNVRAENRQPVAVLDFEASINQTIVVDVLDNDSDPDGDNITIDAIITSPNNGGTATINDNGTPSNSSDDFIDYTPSGSYFGVETFDYSICDDATMQLCDTATVSITITDCVDGSTTNGDANFPFGSQWKYFDAGSDLGSGWAANAYNDKCWNFADAKLGFGDPMTTTINQNAGVTYYFRKHFTVADVEDINYLKIDLVRDDGAVVYVNGNEVYRTNMPSGAITYSTTANGPINGSAETAIHSLAIPASNLVNGDNVIAIEVHQSNSASSDLHFDLRMTESLVDQADSVLVDLMQCWNYNDNGDDLGATWKDVSYQEDETWETGQAEFGYGDGDEVTVIDFGGDPANAHPTYYFRHYFSVHDYNNNDSLLLKLRRDDGAVVYINGVEMARSNMPSGTISYGTWASSAINGSGETDFFEYKFLANVLNTGMNVIAVEIHQNNAASSDVTFDLELSMFDGDPNNFVWEPDYITGNTFIDADFDRALTGGDIGAGALVVEGYQDKNKDGIIDDTDPLVATDITLADGGYSLELFPAEVAAIVARPNASSDDAFEDGTTGAVNLTSATFESIDISGSPLTVLNKLTTWKYYETGLPTGSWSDVGYDDSAWPSGAGALGFGDTAITTTIASGQTAYYFRQEINIADPSIANYKFAVAQVRADDGFVIYINGEEVARGNMPSGKVDHGTFASDLIASEQEQVYNNYAIADPGFVTGLNTIAVEVHQVNAVSSDLGFDMSIDAYPTDINIVGLRFPNIQIPQGAKIVDAWLTMEAQEASYNGLVSFGIKGEAADNSASFSATPANISSRMKTSSEVNFLTKFPVLKDEEVRLDGLEDVIFEIVSRAGWSSGNALSLMVSDFNHNYFSLDGGAEPSLVIAYADTANPSVDYIVSIKEETLPETYLYMTEDDPVVTFAKSTRATRSGIHIGYLGTTSMCFASSDDDYDDLHIINRFNGANTVIGPFGGSTEIEAIALSRNADSLFAVDGDEFGIIDVITGQFNAYGTVIGTGNGTAGAHIFNDIDGLAFDLDRGFLWATERRGGQPDMILLIDHTTGLIIPSAFGPGIDYIVATGGGLLEDLDDIAVNPETGNLFAMNNDAGTITNLIEISITTGSVSVINTTGLNDMEGQGFHNDGSFYSTSGRIGIPSNVFYQVDPTTATLTPVGFFKSAGDFEGCDCKSGPFLSLLEGVVFDDTNLDGIFNGVDVLDPGVMVYLYEDLDGDSVISAGDVIIDSVLTDALGAFFFAVNRKGVFLVEIDMGDLPPGSTLTTTDLHEARFVLNGNFDGGNDFGYRNAAVLPVELISFYGQHKEEQNHLYWMTASEINNSHFDIERSYNSVDFTKIGKVLSPNGNSTVTQSYYYNDDSPLLGENYYRLKQVDLDGSVEYSRTIMLYHDKAPTPLQLSAWPNPAHELLNVDGLDQFQGKEVSILITDLLGKVQEVKTSIVDGSTVSIPINHLINGVYLLEITAGELTESISFVKQ